MGTFIAIIVVIISIAIVRNYFIKQSMREEAERSRKEKEEERKQKAEEERLEDLKYDRIINCPQCKGNGECIIAKQQSHQEGYSATSYHMHSEPDDWKKDGTTSVMELYGGCVGISYEKTICPYCTGKGIAYAYFEKKLETCPRCNGSGKVVETVKIKLNYGVRWDEKEITCNKCNGKGESELDIAHVKTLVEHVGVRKRELSKEGKILYAKSKPRFQ